MNFFKFLLWALILSPVLTFTSCSDDDDDHKPQLTANPWNMLSRGDNANKILSAVENLKDNNEELFNELVYRLSTDVHPFGQVEQNVISIEFKSNNDFYSGNEKKGTYELNGSQITFNVGDIKSKYNISFNGENLVLKPDYESTIEIIQPYLTSNEASAELQTALKAYNFTIEFIPVEQTE